MSKYDVAREEAWIKEQMQLDRDREEEIRRRLKLLQDRLQNDINAQWENFAGKQKISLEEAYKLADKMDVEAFARKAKEYVKNKDFSDRANRELRLYNVKMRVSRLELLRNTIKLDVIRTFDGFDSYMGGQLTITASAEFKRQAGILGTTLSKDYQIKAGKIVDGSFQVSPTNFPAFSDSIWQYGQELISDLDKLIVQSINQGRNPKQLSGQLRDYLVADGKANSKYKLNRLMVSEVTRVQTAVQKQSYTDADIDEYIYIFEPGACKVCLEVARKGPYKVSEMEVGKNAPTMHPGCRCSTAAYMDREKIMADLDKRGLTKEKGAEKGYNSDEEKTDKLINPIKDWGLSRNDAIKKLKDEFGMDIVETSRTKLSETALNQTYSVLKAFENVYTKLPQKIPELRAVTKGKAKNSIASYTRSAVSNDPVRFSVNVGYFDNEDKLKNLATSLVKQGWFSNNSNANHIMIHEFGHHFDYQMSKLYEGDFSHAVLSKMVNAYEDTYDLRTLAKETGGYAKSYFLQKGKHTETFAELFSEAYGDSPRQIAIDFKEQLEKLAKEVLENAG